MVWPLWRYVGDGDYQPSCQACAAAQDRAFDAQSAIHFAWALCKLHIYLNDPPARHESAVTR
jgi:hypothetical protein